MSEMVERVARGLAVKNNAPEWVKIDEVDCGDRGYLLREDYLNLARAAIEALREATFVMSDAGQAVVNIDPNPGKFELLARDEIDAIWRAMIDEALK